MSWKYIKANWFMGAIILLLIAAIVRKKIPLGSWLGITQPPTQNLYTDKSQGTTQMSVVTAPTTGTTTVVTDEKTVQFIARFSNVATGERKKFAIPASIILGIAILNSESGQNNPASQANNYFALPCADDWEGASLQIDGHCMRKYATPWESFRDFSIYLSVRDWYGDLKKAAEKDPKIWGQMLGDKGIIKGTDAGIRLAALIEQYNLAQFD